MFSKGLGVGKSKGKGNESTVTSAPPTPDPEHVFFMPSEEEPHEGTWLQWPHDHGKGGHRQVQRHQESWIQMTLALHSGEQVHLTVCDEEQRARVHALLLARDCDMRQIDFSRWPTNDAWIRDNRGCQLTFQAMFSRQRFLHQLQPADASVRSVFRQTADKSSRRCLSLSRW
jgi:hypothetical protein